MSNFLKQSASTGLPTGTAMVSADLPTITLTGNITGSASGGSISTTIASSAVVNSMLAQMPASTIKGNNTAGSANPTDLSVAQVQTMLSVPTASSPLPINAGGTGGSSVVSTPAATSWAGWDANKNLSANNVIDGSATTSTAAATTTLTAASAYSQQFTGTTTQTVVLPDATTLAVGQSFMIMNRSTGVVTVNANGGSLVQTMAPGSQTVLRVINNGSSTGVWDSAYSSTAGGTFNTYRAGVASIGSAATSLAVTFSSAMASTSYALSVNMRNTGDTNPQFQPLVVTAYSTTGFTVKWDAPTATANYSLMYIAMPNN